MLANKKLIILKRLFRIGLHGTVILTQNIKISKTGPDFKELLA